MHILCPGKEEEQLLLPGKSFIFPLFREFKPQTSERVGLAGEFINFFQSSFMYALANSRRKTLLREDQISSPTTSTFSAQGVTSVRTCSYLTEVPTASPSKGEDRGLNSALCYTSINSRWADWVHIPAPFLIYLHPTVWTSSQLLGFTDEPQFAKKHFK